MSSVVFPILVPIAVVGLGGIDILEFHGALALLQDYGDLEGFAAGPVNADLQIAFGGGGVQNRGYTGFIIVKSLKVTVAFAVNGYADHLSVFLKFDGLKVQEIVGCRRSGPPKSYHF